MWNSSYQAKAHDAAVALPTRMAVLILIMQREANASLQLSLPYLCRNLDLDPVLFLLRSTRLASSDGGESILNKEAYDSIQSGVTTGERVSELVRTLQRRPAGAFAAFLSTLRRTGQDHVAQEIQRRLEQSSQSDEGERVPNMARSKSSSVGPQELDDAEKRVLAGIVPELCRGVSSLAMVLVHLQSYLATAATATHPAVFVFEEDQVDQVEVQRTESQKVAEMVLLLKQGPGGFQALCKALRETGQPWLAEEMERRLVKEKVKGATSLVTVMLDL